MSLVWLLRFVVSTNRKYRQAADDKAGNNATCCHWTAADEVPTASRSCAVPWDSMLATRV